MAQKVSSLAIDINVTGAPQASAALSGVERTGKSAGESLAAMATKAGAAGAAITAVTVASRKFLEAAEQYNRIGAKLAVVTENARQATGVQSQLFKVAQETGAEFEALVGTYARVALSAKDLNVTQAQMVQLTANVAKSLQVSGASASEAAAGATQLAQALGSGRLQGDELKSILENAPVLARSIAAGLGVSVGQLRQMGSEGKLLSRDVFGAILKQTDTIDAQFDKIGTSMERSGTRLQNSFTRALSAIDNKIGASRQLSALMDYLSGAIDGTTGSGGKPTPVAAPSRASTAITDPTVLSALSGLRGAQSAANRPTPSRPPRAAATPRRSAVRESPGPNPAPLGSGVLGRGGFEARSAGILSTMNSANGGRDRDFSGGIVGQIGGQLEAQLAAVNERVASLGASVGATLADSIANGITAAVQSGSIGAGFAELGRTLVGGLGAAVRDFGMQSLIASQLMEKIKLSLASFLPGGAIGASVALIALGSAMVGLAGRGARASFGTTNTGINRGATASQTITTTGSLSSSVFGTGTASAPSAVSGSVANAGNVVVLSPTIIGTNDPRAQRELLELIGKGQSRGGF